MIRSLVAACLSHRIVVVALAAIVLVVGVVQAQRAPLDAFPEFAPPLVEVQTEAPGLSSLEVESLVTIPLENVLAGTSFSTTVRSKSVLGLSSVVLFFEQGTDIFLARQLVQERLGRAAALLPVTARAPVMLPPVSSTSRAQKIGLTSKTLSQTDLTDLVRTTVRPRLLAIPGVANVAVWGARERTFEIRLDPVRLDAQGLTADDVVRAVQAATTPTSGGYLDGPLQRLPLQHVSPIRVPADLASLAIASRGGTPVRVTDVGDVVEGFPQPIGDAVVNDEPGLLLIVEKQPWGNTLEITRKVDEAFATLKPAMPGVDVDTAIFRPAAFIERSIGNLQHAMVVGCVLVVLVLIAFLWSWRTAVISALAIPLSLFAAVLVMRALGTTINTMVLAGLVIALGEVVDDAIIDVENILRRLRENRTLPSPRSSLAVALDASLEVRSAVVYATAVVVVVFLPVWFLEGVSGAFFRPLAMAYGLGVLASMIVALTVTPALSLLLLPRGLDKDHDRHSPLMLWLAARYAHVLPKLLARPRRIIAGGASALVLAGVGFTLLGDAFLPEFKENDFLMHWVAQPGTSLPALRRTTIDVSKELRAVPGVTSFGAHIGRAEAADEIVGPNFTELWIHVDESRAHDDVAHDVREIIARWPGLRRDLETYLRERVGEVVSGAHGAIVVRVYGDDLDVLRTRAASLAGSLRDVTGVTQVQVEQQAMVPEVRVELRPDAAAAGFLAGDVRRAVGLFVRGERVGEIFREARSIPIFVRGTDAVREDLSALRDVLLTSSTGQRARLGDVASLTVGPTPNMVPHEAGSRRIDLSLSVSGDLGKAADDVSRIVAGADFPRGVHAEVLGEWKERQSASRRLAVLSLLSLGLVLLVLYTDLQTVRRTALVATSLPFALVGGVVGAWAAGGVLSLGSLVGLVTVLGIAARNGILLVSHYRQLEQEGVPFGPELVLRGSVERVGPILMTAIATGLALVPLVVAGDAPGHEIEHPMAVVILAGLISSTVLNLVVLPALYLRFGSSGDASTTRETPDDGTPMVNDALTTLSKES